MSHLWEAGSHGAYNEASSLCSGATGDFYGKFRYHFYVSGPVYIYSCVIVLICLYCINRQKVFSFLLYLNWLIFLLKLQILQPIQKSACMPKCVHELVDRRYNSLYVYSVDNKVFESEPAFYIS